MNRYTSGRFAKLANVTIRTIRYYDKKGLLKPSFVASNGYRYYCDSDFVKLQQILLFKYLGFSLNEIKNMILNDNNYCELENALFIQKKIIRDKIDHMMKVEKAIDDTILQIKNDNTVNWENMINLIHLSNESENLYLQYQNAINLNARINLHDKYSVNNIKWFDWVYNQLNIKSDDVVLELGCGDGTLWKNRDSKNSMIILSDKYEGMINDARRNLGDDYTYQIIDFMKIPYDDNQFDIVICNHVLFYADELIEAIKEIYRILKHGGILICSTYGKAHMIEITNLCKKFDENIILSSEELFEKFGKDNGSIYLKKYFSDIRWKQYDDYLMVRNSDDLVRYILSCHGNQNEFILSKYRDFHRFVDKEVGDGFRISKDAGIFVCKK